MKDSGIYSLIIKLDRDQTIRVGNLGKVKFPKGVYVYTGSALSGLEARINRHKKKQKKMFWHIDYLLASRYAKILKVMAIKTSKKLECRLNEIVSSLPKAQVVAKGFGCSDCDCKSHLIYFDNKSLFRLLRSKFKFSLYE